MFTYAREEGSIDAKVAAYARTLGTPVRAESAGQRSASWQDARTRFEITERDAGLEAVLADLATITEPHASAGERPGR